MSTDPRDILRLKHCPQCGYDLAALPRSYRCPECGFEYDESMFAIAVWRHGDRPNPWMVLMMAFLILVCVPVSVAALFFLPLISVYRTFFWPAMAVASVYGLFNEVRKYVLSSKAQTNSLLLAGSRHTALRWDGRWLAGREWSKLKGFKFRRTWRRKWRLRLRQKWWHSIVGRDVDVVFDASRREAALIRSEVQRRIQAAPEAQKRATTMRS